MVKLCLNELCTGCGACMQVCSNDAIKMVEDLEGFLQPAIQKDKCIMCKKCETVCPILNYCDNNRISMECYAIKANDEIREVSTSGGFFSILSNYVLENSGYVCGAIMNPDFTVEHILSNNVDDVARMRGSKYTQSNTNDMFQKIEKLLKKEIPVLFTGTPCQVAGLKNYLGVEYKELITVDVICRGVPSNKVLNKYLRDTYKGKKIKKVLFRNKEYFRWTPNMRVETDEGEIYHSAWMENDFYKAFFNNISMRKSCGQHCRYNNYSRCSDITMGDFWGLPFYEESIKISQSDNRPMLTDQLGTSLVVINNQKGKQIFEKCAEQYNVCVPITIMEASNENLLAAPAYVDLRKRKRFFKLLDKMPFEKAYEYSISNQYDIAICGLWYSNNYGSLLTARGLYEVLCAMGYEVVFVDSVYSDSNIEARVLEYITNNCDTTIKYNDINHLRELNNKCDTFIVGSDQCWANHLNKMFGYEFLLNYVDDNKKKISFSTSFGRSEFYGTKKEIECYQYYLRKFDAVSVRENSGKDICKNYFNIEAEHVVDPIFLRETTEYEDEAKLANLHLPEEYVLNYILDIRPQTPELLNRVNRKLEMQVLTILGLMVTNPWEATLEGVVEQPTEYEFLAYFNKCKYVVTDTYHGMCMAIIFKKPFTVIINEGRGRARFDSLLKMFELEHRAVEYQSFCEDSIEKMAEIDWNRVDRKLEEFKCKSIKWLKNAINQPKDTIITDDIVTNARIDEVSNMLKTLQQKVNLNSSYISSTIKSQIYGYFAGALKEKDNVLIRGGGKHTAALLEVIMPVLKEKNITFKISDRGEFRLQACGELFEVQVMRKELLEDIDCVIISSWGFRNQMKEELMTLDIDLEKTRVLDIYSDLHIDKEKPFYVFE